VCPFLEDADARCAAYHSLSQLEQALGRCVDHYQDCPIYREKLLVNAPRPRQVAKSIRAAG
jgi:hypothetical protein